MSDSLRTFCAAMGLERDSLQSLPFSGYSGAKLSRIWDRAGNAYVIKDTSLQSDWIMQATDDLTCRDAVVSCMSGIRQAHSPAIMATVDGTTSSLLMIDVQNGLLPARLTTEELKTILDAARTLHTMQLLNGPWCDHETRLRLMTPRSLERARKQGADAIAERVQGGWAEFHKVAPREISQLINTVSVNLGPLVRALSCLPQGLLHGDLKLENIAFDRAGSLRFFDWAMSSRGAAPIDLSWFLATSTGRLPVRVDEALAMYLDGVELARDSHKRFEALTGICGLLLQGWRVSRLHDAASCSEFHWWCELAMEGSKYLCE